MAQNGSAPLRPEHASALQAVPVDDLIEDALVAERTTLAGRRVSVYIAAEVPLVRVDPVATEMALRKALRDAARTASDAAEITVSATVWQRAVEVRVGERGRDVHPIRLDTGDAR